MNNFLLVGKYVFVWLAGNASKSFDTRSWLFEALMSLFGTFTGNVGTSVVLRIGGMVVETLATELNDLIGSEANVVDKLDVIKGIEEEKVFVTHDMVEVTNEDDTLFTTADGGIIENKGLVVAERAVDCARLQMMQHSILRLWLVVVKVHL